MFQEHWCNRCKRDRAFRVSVGYAEGCSILSDTMAYASDDPKYPKEWVWNPEELRRTGALGFNAETGARCMAFEPEFPAC